MTTTRLRTEHTAHMRTDLVEVVALVLRRCADTLRTHNVIVRVDVAEGATALVDDGQAAERALSALLVTACVASPPFAHVSLSSRVRDGHVELLLDANGSCSVVRLT